MPQAKLRYTVVVRQQHLLKICGYWVLYGIGLSHNFMP